MNKYLGLYNTHSEFNNGASLSEPYVAYCKDENHVHYGPQTPFNGHAYVDLGLPSGTLWATCNVGANSPEEYGDYFAWGEIVPNKIENYTWDNYRFGTSDTLTKYTLTDKKITLDLEDDAAHVVMGGEWHMPSEVQLNELIENTTYSWTTDYNGTGVAGAIFTSNINGNSVFFPAAGTFFSNGITSRGEILSVWSSSRFSSSGAAAWHLYSNTGDMGVSVNARKDGCSVRGVIGDELILESQ